MWIERSALAMIGVAAITWSTVCLADDVQVAHAGVTGPEGRVYEFHQNLTGFLGDKNLADAGIVCDGCDALREDPPYPEPPWTDETNVDYTFFRDHERLEAFILAWGKLQTRAFAAVAIKFDMQDILTPDCASFVPQPCVNAPFCPGPPRGCSKTSTPPCKKCGT